MSKTRLSAVLVLVAASLLAQSCAPEAISPTATSSATLPAASFTVEELRQRLDGGSQGLLLLDVRPAKDYAAGHIEGAVSMPVADIPERYGEIPEGVEVVVYTCFT